MKRFFLTLTVFAMFFGVSVAQDTNTDNHQVTISIPSVALLDIETAASKNFTLTVKGVLDNEAGNPLDFTASNSDLWLNYTSIVSSSQSRKIQAQITNGSLPSGVTLSVTAANTTSGYGTKGKGSTQNLSVKETVDLITGIGSVYTENGPKKGSQLTYNMTMANDNYANIFTAEYPVTVTYTIVDK
jgi:hypothetical protein